MLAIFGVGPFISGFRGQHLPVAESRPQGAEVYAIIRTDESCEAGVTGMRRMSFAYGRERSLPLVFGGIRMSDQRTKEISVFVDESGSFESDEESSRFYLVCFVLHDQSADISEWVGNLEDYLDARGLGREHCVHVELHNLGSSVNCLGRRLTTYTTRDRKEIAKLLSQVP